MKKEVIGNATLYCGDCMDILPELAGMGIDVVITDPPYGCTENKWDKVGDWTALWALLKACAKPNAAHVLFANMRFAVELINTNPKMFRYDLVWKKTVPVGFLNARRMPLRTHENILLFYRSLPTYNPQKTDGHKPVAKYGYRSVVSSNHRVNILTLKGLTKNMTTSQNYNAGWKLRAIQHCTASKKFGNSYKNHYKEMRVYDVVGTTTKRYPQSVLEFKKSISVPHPTAKPVPLMEWLIKTYTNAGETVFDPFMGSGTTGVAALKNGRHFLGIEQEPKYFDIACKRIEAEWRTPSLFLDTDTPQKEAV